MEVTKQEQLLKKFKNILIDNNEYYKAVDEKIELIKEIVVDFRTNLKKLGISLLIFIKLLKNLRIISPKPANCFLLWECLHGP